MEKVFGYMRVSGLGQVEGDGFERQKKAIEAYAASHGYKVVRLFREEGVSGTKATEDRPALRELIAALHSNGIRVVIVERLDRLARDLMVQETIIGDLRKHGFELISTAERDLCADDPTRVLMRQFMGAIAQYERTMIVIKLRAARRRKRDAVGHCEGRPAYGANDEERKVIDRMFALNAEGASVASIHKRLNAERIPTRHGREWTPATVSRIMKRFPERLSRPRKG